MQAEQALDRLGGVAGTTELLALTTRRRLRTAVRRGTVQRVGRGRYALPTADEARVAAARLAGVVALRSAAAAHGWELKEQPAVPEVMVRADRHLASERRDGVRVLWSCLDAAEVEAGVTGPVRTLVDCARRLPFDEALAVADSALRSGQVTAADLAAVRARVRGAGADGVRRVLDHADGRAANPFESVLRAHCLDAGLVPVPQMPLDLGSGRVQPDLVLPIPRVALEADSWTWHTGRRAHRRDCARYNLLVLRGWRVLRFTWEQVMHEPAYVRWVLAELDRPHRQEDVGDAGQVPA